MNWENFLSADRLRQSNRDRAGVDNRNEFESDYGRIMFSPATRRMHDKTQVQPLTTNDNIHSRLTHSMEVMTLGYSIGIRLCENETFITYTELSRPKIDRELPIILQNACLIHDIGNPPFGHFGETAIQNYFKKLFADENKNGRGRFELSDAQKKDFVDFDGNAQGFRVLTKLQYLNDLYGLNLTCATLGAFLKYPCLEKNEDAHIITKHKKGVFSTEEMYLWQIAEKCGLMQSDDIIRHPLTFLVEAADTICYRTMDIEDGFNKKWYSYNDIKVFLSDNEMCKKIISDSERQLHDKAEKEGRDFAKMSEIEYVVNLRIKLIGYLMEVTIQNFIDNIEEICNGTYHYELLSKDSETAGVSETLSSFCTKKIFSNRDILSLEITGHSVITGLLDYFIDFIFQNNTEKPEKDSAYQIRAKGLISKSIIEVAKLECNFYDQDLIHKLPDYYKLRVVVDYISGMTDQFALNQFQKLSGQKI